MAEFSGGCLCGAVRYVCSGAPVVAGHCHCEDCRRSSGTGHCSHLAVPEATLQCRGSLRVYRRAADSGNVVARHFCPECGAPLYSTNPAMPGLVFLRASSLDDLEIFQPQMHVYVSRAASWDPPSPALPSFALLPAAMDAAAASS